MHYQSVSSTKAKVRGIVVQSGSKQKLNVLMAEIFTVYSNKRKKIKNKEPQIGGDLQYKSGVRKHQKQAYHKRTHTCYYYSEK